MALVGERGAAFDRLQQVLKAADPETDRTGRGPGADRYHETSPVAAAYYPLSLSPNALPMVRCGGAALPAARQIGLPGKSHLA